MKKEDIVQLATKLNGKKARVKRLKTQPQSDKAQKLPKEVRQGLEEHFGAKLAKVRVHTGGNLKDVGKELKAKSFTIGENIYFAKPGDAKNRELLAHELTHVIQQTRGKMPKRAKAGTALVSK